MNNSKLQFIRKWKQPLIAMIVLFGIFLGQYNYSFGNKFVSLLPTEAHAFGAWGGGINPATGEYVAPPGSNTDPGPPDKTVGTLTSYVYRSILGIGDVVIQFEGMLLSVIIRSTLWVVGINNFVTSRAVQVGWTLVRDIANMFFIIILLAIAIGTILRVESYNFKKMLPKVLIMAVLVNFSLLICGLIIDGAQIAMATFAAGYAGTAGEGNMARVLNLDEILNQGTGNPDSRVTSDTPVIDARVMVASMILGVIMLLIAMIVTFIVLIVLLFRILMLWILIVLSPLAFVLSAFPQGQKYASQWWQEFSKYVIIGPILAFFLWLAFAIPTQTNNGAIGPEVLDPSGSAPTEFNTELSGSQGVSEEGTTTFIQAAGGPGGFISFIIGIGMLLGGLMVTQQMGVGGASLAGAAYGKIRGAGVKAALSPLTGAKYGAKALGSSGAWFARKTKAGAVPGLGWAKGVELNPANVVRNIRGAMERKKDEDIRVGNMAASSLLNKGGVKGAVLGLGASRWGDEYMKGFMYSQGVKRMVFGKAGKAGEFEELADEQDRIANMYTADELADHEAEAQAFEENTQGLENQLQSGVMSRFKGNEVDSTLKETSKQLRNEAEAKVKQAEETEDEEAANELLEAARQLEAAAVSLEEVEIGEDVDLNSDTLPQEAKARFRQNFEEKVTANQVMSAAKRAEIAQNTRNGAPISADDRENAKKMAAEYRRKADRAAAYTPQDTYARGERRAAFEEERKLHGSTTNEYELIAAFKSAVTRGEMTEAGGVALQATKVGHLNELVQASRASKNYYFDKNGSLTTNEAEKDERYGDKGVAFKEGQSFSSDINGFHAFMNDVFVDKLAMPQQAALSLQNDLSNLAESINHWTFGQAVTAAADGTYSQNSKKDQEIRVKIEMGKRDAERLTRESNRLAFMTEDWIDDKDHSKGRKAILNDVGIAHVEDSWQGMEANFSRNRVNKNFALNLMSDENKKIMDIIGETKIPDGMKGKWNDFRKKLADYAGKASEESGSLGQRTSSELRKAQDIRAQVTGRRETYVEGGPIEVPELEVNVDLGELQNSMNRLGDQINNAVAGNDDSTLVSSFDEIVNELRQLNSNMGGSGMNTISKDIEKLITRASVYRNNPQASRAGSDKLLRDIRDQLMEIRRITNEDNNA